MTFTPSPYQQKIFDWIRVGKGSAVVTAVAGSGKTTTTIRCLKEIPESRSVRLLAFNTDIAKEFNAKIDELREETGREFRNVKGGTFHSLGFGSMLNYLKGRGIDKSQVKPDSNKCRKLFRDQVGESTAEIYSDFVCKLVGLAKGEGIGVLVPDTTEHWFSLVRHHDLYLEASGASEEEAIELARDLLRLSNREADRGNIDFDDMLLMPLIWKLRLWQNDWVFVDEAQDTNPVRRALIRLIIRPGGRLVAVGDPCQAIYGFTGASHDAIDLIKRDFRAIELPLTVSYRCSRAVVEQAKEYVSHIEPFEAAQEGKVETMSIKEAVKILTPNDAILCRQTAPLIATAYALISRGTGCRVAGRDIGAGLVSLVKRQRADNLARLEERLLAYRDREVSKWLARGEEQKAESIKDRVECVEIVMNALPEDQRTVSGLISHIEALFEENNGQRLILSTVHKSKGREWDRVVILRPDLMPSKWARQEHQYQQEVNLQYVAATRAKTHLVYTFGDLKDA